MGTICSVKIRLVLMFVIGHLLLQTTTAINTNCNATCELPDCYCDYEAIPGGYPAVHTPQMVLFTYTGPVTTAVREAIVDVFPDSLSNPNGCSVGITLFVISQGSDDCGVYRMYYRGHEIALAGTNRTSWKNVDWTGYATDQQTRISSRSNVDALDITGMRAQSLKPGGDNQFNALQDAGLIYDSSLLAGPVNVLDRPYYWPFTLDHTLDELGLQCKNSMCPTEPYPGVWEIPVASLLGTRMGKPRSCTYLDDCLSDLKTGTDVFNLLEANFKHSHEGNRAPFQVNLQPRSLATKIVVQGLKQFVAYILRKPNTWVITNQEALRWSQKPIPLSTVITSGVWDCPARGKYLKCEFSESRGSEKKDVNFSSIMNVKDIWIWQTMVLGVLYFVVYRYDRYVNP